MHKKLSPLLGLFGFCLSLTGCTSDSQNAGGSDAYGAQLGQQTKSMSKNIGKEANRRVMNKAGNKLLGSVGL